MVTVRYYTSYSKKSLGTCVTLPTDPEIEQPTFPRTTAWLINAPSRYLTSLSCLVEPAWFRRGCSDESDCAPEIGGEPTLRSLSHFVASSSELRCAPRRTPQSCFFFEIDGRVSPGVEPAEIRRIHLTKVKRH